jgi:hypothetical protein
MSDLPGRYSLALLQGFQGEYSDLKIFTFIYSFLDLVFKASSGDKCCYFRVVTMIDKSNYVPSSAEQ